MTMIFGVALLGTFANTRAGDWPQALGPQRDGSAQNERLPKRLPAQPTVVWKRDVGQGYAGPAVVGDRVFLFDRVGDQERLTALDRHRGEVIWEQIFPATYRGGVDPDAGPRCVPVVHGDSIVVLGAGGGLHCLQAADGKRRWSHDLVQEFRAQEGYFGFGSSPLVGNGLVLVNVGGASGAGIVGFHLQDGSVHWKATQDDASYSGPTWLPHGNASPPLAVFVTRLHLRVINATDGAIVYEHPFGRRGPTVNAATPLVLDEGIFVTANYGVGAILLDWMGAKSTVIWESDEALSSQYNTPISLDGHLYGIHGREDAGVAELRCIETQTGRVKWSVREFGVAHLIRADRRALALKVDGTMLVFDLDPAKYAGASAGEGVCRVSASATRSLPALSGGHLYVRDHRGDGGSLYCLSLDSP